MFRIAIKNNIMSFKNIIYQKKCCDVALLTQ